MSASRELNRVPSYTRWALETRVSPTWVKKILGFYKAPVTKFWSNVVSAIVIFVFIKPKLITELIGQTVGDFD